MVYKYWDSITVRATSPFCSSSLLHALTLWALCRKRTWNSPLAPRRLFGKSKIHYWQVEVQAPWTTQKRTQIATTMVVHLPVLLVELVESSTTKIKDQVLGMPDCKEDKFPYDVGNVAGWVGSVRDHVGCLFFFSCWRERATDVPRYSFFEWLYSLGFLYIRHLATDASQLNTHRISLYRPSPIFESRERHVL